MSFSLSILASGSRGNALVINAGDTTIMIDCGLGVRTLMPLLQSVGVQAKNLDAILITHEHTDHMRGLERFLNHTRAPLYATEGTFDAIEHVIPTRTPVRIVTQETFEIGTVKIRAIPVPHDANEPVAFHLAVGRHRLTVATDLGEVTPEISQALWHSTVAVFESNHDEEMLANGTYPEVLKRRICSGTGHLSNSQCAAALQACRDTELCTVILAHLSDENNDPEMARLSAESVLNSHSCSLHVTRQGAIGPFLKFEPQSKSKGYFPCEPLQLFP